jgi:hypothetical protein
VRPRCATDCCKDQGGKSYVFHYRMHQGHRTLSPSRLLSNRLYQVGSAVTTPRPSHGDLFVACRPIAGDLALGRRLSLLFECRNSGGGLNGSTQHFILERDGGCCNGSRVLNPIRALTPHGPATRRRSAAFVPMPGS